MADEPDLWLDFHGVRARVFGAAELTQALAFDFAHHRCPPGPTAEVSISVSLEHPPFERAPEGRCVLVQPHAIVFDAGGARWVDYHSRALCRFDYEADHGELWSEDLGLAHEIAYLLLLSRVGEHLDRRGLHRVHALGLDLEGAGVLCLLPSGGGKTTLGLAMLERTGAALLSDDTPLVTRTGELLGFAARIGVNELPRGLTEGEARRFVRTGRHDKLLIDATRFRLSDRAMARVIVIGERRLSGPSELVPIPARAAFPEVFRSLVVGVGLPQVIEYFLRFDVADVARKSPLVASRTWAATAVLARSKAYRFRMSRDVEDNAEQLHRLLLTLRP